MRLVSGFFIISKRPGRVLLMLRISPTWSFGAFLKWLMKNYIDSKTSSMSFLSSVDIFEAESRAARRAPPCRLTFYWTFVINLTTRLICCTIFSTELTWVCRIELVSLYASPISLKSLILFSVSGQLGCALRAPYTSMAVD